MMIRQAAPLVGFVLFALVLIPLAFPNPTPAPAVAPEADVLTGLMCNAPTGDWHRMGKDTWLLSYDGRTRSTRWTLEYLTADSVKAKVARTGEHFRQANAPKEFSAAPADYARSGFDIGHQAAAANHATALEALEETFTTANATPQTPALNRGRWRELEIQIRALTGSSRCVWVVTAPIWKPAGRVDGTAWVTIQMIGANDVWVPTHCGKAILIEREGPLHGHKPIECRAWIVPNVDDPPPLDDCRVTTDEFERATGLDVWQSLPHELEERLEAAAL